MNAEKIMNKMFGNMEFLVHPDKIKQTIIRCAK